MRVFLTGATGFVGAHLLRILLDRGVPTAALVRPGSRAARIADLRGRFTEIPGDLAHSEALARPLNDFAPDTVLHLAWEGVGNKRRNDPLQLEHNLPRSLRLLQVAAAAGVEHWIALGSQGEYGPCDIAIAEDQPPRPTTLYGVAKLATCQGTEILCRELGLRFAWLRLFSVYGPMDDSGWLIPFIILELLHGRSPPLTDGWQKWDYLYVEDVAEAIATVAADPRAEGVFNLGSGEPRSVRSIAQAIGRLVDPSLELRFGEIPLRPDQIMHLEADVRRLRETGWRPRVPFPSGIEKTVHWFREHKDQLDA
jgi:nucleoside-diphosphate-sugar epimerase